MAVLVDHWASQQVICSFHIHIHLSKILLYQNLAWHQLMHHSDEGDREYIPGHTYKLGSLEGGGEGREHHSFVVLQGILLLDVNLA